MDKEDIMGFLFGLIAAVICIAVGYTAGSFVQAKTGFPWITAIKVVVPPVAK